MNVSYPTGALTKLAQVFAQPRSNADTLKAQAYMMAAGANRDRDLAAADEYRAKTAEREARNNARTPEALLSTALMGMGMSPQAPQARDLAEAFSTGRNPMTPAQPAVELPAVNDSPLASFNLSDVVQNPRISLETLAPAVQAQERPVDPALLGDLARRVGDFMGMQAATGDTNYDQFQGGVDQRMQNQILQKAVSGVQLSPQDMALLKASAVFNSQGINNYTGQGGDAFDIDQANAMQRERIQSNDRRYSTNVGAATTRRGQDMTDSRGRWEHTTPGAGKGTTDKAAAEEREAINSIDLTLPIVPQVAKSDPDYQQFYRIYTNAKNAGDLRTLRALVHKAVKNGIIQQGE